MTIQIGDKVKFVNSIYVMDGISNGYTGTVVSEYDEYYNVLPDQPAEGDANGETWPYTVEELEKING